MSIIALSYLISILYSGLKHGEEPNFTPRRIPESPPGTHGPSRAPDVCVALGADAASDCLGSASIDCSPGASYTAPSRRETYKAADIVIFDPDTIASKPRGLVDDLPGGAMHVKQGALGIDDVIVNSEVLREGGEHTGALPGQVLRGPLDDGNREGQEG